MKKKPIKSIYARGLLRYKMKSLRLLYMVNDFDFNNLLTSFDLFYAYFLNSNKRMWTFALN
jgi:hypothetical protein